MGDDGNHEHAEEGAIAAELGSAEEKGDDEISDRGADRSD